MKGWAFLLAFLLLLPGALAQDLLDFDSLWLKINLNNTLQLVKENDQALVEEVTSVLAWFPRENFQAQVQYITTSPKADFLNDGLRFKWEFPSQDSLTLSWTSQVNVTRKFKPVYSKVKFPLSKVDPSLGQYLLPQEIIDSSEEITGLAASLAEGEEDLYGVVFKMAEWVRSHVHYNLSTLTADASQKASWVLREREGVCDEITSLFIALLRALGIPARFAAGVSYTNIPGVPSWGPHGWAEVFFPGYGWVPFDVTYGEYGWLDAGHVKLDDSLDSKKSTITYTARGRGVSLSSQGVGWDVEVLEKGRLPRDLLNLKFSPYAESVGFGSYNLLTLEAENLENYYVPSKFHLYKTEGLEVLEERTRMELFRPREKKKLYWVVKVAEDLKADYQYTFPLRMDSGMGGARNAVFTSKTGEVSFPSGLFTSIVGSEESLVKKPYSKIVEFACSPDKDKAKLGEVITVFCNLSNHGDTVLKSVRLCLDEDCQRVNVGAGGVESTSFVKSFDNSLSSVLVITAENENVSKAAYVRVNVLATPKLNITVLASPAVMEFKDKAPVRFRVERESLEVPRNVTVSVKYKYAETKWMLDELTQPFEFDLNIHGSRMDFETPFVIQVQFKDEFNDLHQTQKNFSVKLVNLSIPETIQVYVNRIAFGLERVLKKIF